MPAITYPKHYLYSRIVKAKLFMDNHYAASIDVNNIADEAYFSKFHFIRLFRDIYGKTPHQYLMHVRLEKASLLLKQGISVSDTCMQVGFESTSSFSGLFKRFAGLSPSAFLLQQQAKQLQIANRPLAYVPGCFAHEHGWAENSNFEEATI